MTNVNANLTLADKLFLIAATLVALIGVIAINS